MHFQTVYKLFVGKPVTYKANTKAFEFFLNILLVNFSKLCPSQVSSISTVFSACASTLNNAIVSKYAAQGKY